MLNIIKRAALVGSFSFFALFIGIQVAHADRQPCPRHVACEGDMENCSCNEYGGVDFLVSWNAEGMYCYFYNHEWCGDENMGVTGASDCGIPSGGVLDYGGDDGECYPDEGGGEEEDDHDDKGEAGGSHDTVTYEGRVYTLDCWNSVLEEGFDEGDAASMCSPVGDVEDEVDEAYECWSQCLEDGGEEYDCTEDCGYGDEEESETHCGSARADRGPFPEYWNAYTCQEANAGGCLSRRDYTSSRSHGCPGNQRCCAPLFTGELNTTSEEDADEEDSGLDWRIILLVVGAGWFFFFRKKDQS